MEIIDSILCYKMTNSTDCMENLQELVIGAFTVCTGEAPLLFVCLFFSWPQAIEVQKKGRKL